VAERAATHAAPKTPKGAPHHEGKSEELTKTLGKKAGPLPVWVWVVVGIGVIYLLASGQLSGLLGGLSSSSAGSSIGAANPTDTSALLQDQAASLQSQADQGQGNANAVSASTLANWLASQAASQAGANQAAAGNSLSEITAAINPATGQPLTMQQAHNELAALSAAALTVGQVKGNSGLLASLHFQAQTLRELYPGAGPAGGYTPAGLASQGYSMFGKAQSAAASVKASHAGVRQVPTAKKAPTRAKAIASAARGPLPRAASHPISAQVMQLGRQQQARTQSRGAVTARTLKSSPAARAVQRIGQAQQRRATR
jgi:hypothetical protein